jgi:hypothetical protein
MAKGGAPKGNQNARKHGFYSKALDEAGSQRSSVRLLEYSSSALSNTAPFLSLENVGITSQLITNSGWGRLWL